MNSDSKTTTENPFTNFKARSLLLWGFLIPVALGFALGLISGFSRFNPTDPIFGLIIGSLTFVLLALWAIYRLRRLHINVKHLIGSLPNNYPWLPTVGIVIAILLFSLGSGQLFYSALSFAAPELVTLLLDQKVFLSSSETVVPLLYNLLVIISFLVVAPVTEELLFRGILLHRWTAKWGIAPALFSSSLLFGILHANIIGLFVFGLMMTLLYLKTRTLIVPMVCHALNNLVAVGLGLVSTGSSTTEPVNALEQVRSNWWVGIVYVALSAPWLITFIYKNWPKPSLPLPYLSNAAQ